MENLTKFDGLETNVTRIGDSVITTIKAGYGISPRGAIDHNGKTVLANVVYKKDGTYDLVYTIVGSDGNNEGNFLEYAGVLSTLFKSPNDEIYVSLVDTRTEKEQEIDLPLIERAAFDEPKHARSYAGKYIDNVGQSAIFHDVDIFSEKKPDTLLFMAFENGAAKKRNKVKLEFPKDNKISVYGNEIHLVGRDKEGYIHRQIDEKGNEIKKRKINMADFWCREALKLSFDGPSSLISDEEGKITLITIDGQGKYKAKTLMDIEDELYNTRRPTSIGNNRFVIGFNTEYGNGWFTIKEDEIIEFYYDKGGKGYKNLVSGETISIGENDFIIDGIEKTKENGYAVILSRNSGKSSEEKSREIVLLNRIVGRT